MKNEGIRYHHYDSAEIKSSDYADKIVPCITVEVDTT